MTVRVLLFARLKELVGSGTLELEVAEGATVGDVWRRLQELSVSLVVLARPPLAAVNQEYASPETVLAGGEEVAFFPPVSGG